MEFNVRPRKLRQILWSMFIGAAIVFGLYAVLLVSSSDSHAYPDCTNDQPYPSNGWNTCTGYGQECPRNLCAYPPGTPGRWDVNGDYTPRMG